MKRIHNIVDLKELIEVTLLYRKAYKFEQSELAEKFEYFKKIVENRLDRIERVLMPS